MSSCRCPQCYGLREFMLNLTGKDYGLPPASGHTLHVVTPGPDPTGAVTLECACDGSFTCSCHDCEAERDQLVRAGGQGSGHQPWMPRTRKAA